MTLKNILLLPLLFSMITACTWVKLSDEGEKTRVLDASEVTNCTHVGKTTSKTTDVVVGVKRHDEAISLELVSLARNAASRMGGDTVVAEGEVVDGQQVFQIYRCMP